MIRLLICLPLFIAAFRKPLFSNTSGPVAKSTLSHLLWTVDLDGYVRWTSENSLPWATYWAASPTSGFAALQFFGITDLIGALATKNFDKVLDTFFLHERLGKVTLPIFVAIMAIVGFILSGDSSSLHWATVFLMVGLYLVDDGGKRLLAGPGIALLLLSTIAPFLPDLLFDTLQRHDHKYMPAVLQKYVVPLLLPLPHKCYKPVFENFDTGLHYEVAC
jgi:hypothetical protein